MESLVLVDMFDIGERDSAEEVSKTAGWDR